MRSWIYLSFQLLLTAFTAQCSVRAECKIADTSCTLLPLLLYSKVAVATNLYVANATSGSLSEYSIDRTTGQLATIGTATGMAGTKGVQVDPVGRFVFVAAATTPRIHRFALDSTGALTALGTTTPGCTFPEGLAADPGGAYLYAVIAGCAQVEGYTLNASSNQGASNSVSTYRRDSAGLLTLIGNVAAGTALAFLAIDPQGRFLYVSNNNTATQFVSQYRIITGLPVSMGTIAAGDGGYHLDFLVRHFY